MADLASTLQEIASKESSFVLLALGGSVIPNFETLRSAARLCVSAYKGCDVSVIQFGTAATTICSATDDTQRLLAAIEVMRIDEISSNPSCKM